MTTKKVLKKTGKILLYLTATVLVLVIAAYIFINTPYGKRLVRDKVTAYLQHKLQTKVVIGSVDYSLPRWVELKDVYIEDQHKDTLFYGGKLAVNLDMLKLIRGVTYIRKVELENMYANIYRNEKDSAFNFQFIVDAFSSPAKPGAVKDTSALNITLKRVLLNKVRVNFNDKYSGNDFSANVTKLDVSLNKFQPDKLWFDVDKFSSDSVAFTMITTKNTVSKSSVSNAADTQKNPLLIYAAQLDLRNTYVLLDDKTNGLYYTNTVKHLSLDKAVFDMATANGTANSVTLDSSFIRFIAPQKDTVTKIAGESTASSPWKFAVNELQLKNDRFQSDDNAVAPTEGLDFSHLDMDNIRVNAKKIYYSSDSMVAAIDQLSFKDKSSFTVDTTHAKLLYSKTGISATELYVKTPESVVQNTVQLKYDDIKQITTAPQNSSVVVKLNNSVIAVNDLYRLMPSVKKQLAPEKFRDNVVKLNTEITGNLQQLNIPLLQLNGLSGTVINAKATLYNITDTNNLGYDIVIFNSSIPKADMLKFLPAGNEDAKAKLPPYLNLSTQLKGNLKNTNALIDISSNNFIVKGKGNLQNIDRPAALKYDVTIGESRVEKQFLLSVLPKDAVPQSISLPELVLLTGTAKGDMNNVRTDLKLNGSYGIAAVKGTVNNFKDKQRAQYDLVIKSDHFELGKLLKQDTMIGRVSLSSNIKGTGFDYKTMHTDIDATIASAGFKKHDYKNAVISAQLNNGTIQSKGSVSDSAAMLQYDITANLQGDYPAAVKGTVHIDTLRLKELNLYNDTLDIAGKILIDAPATNPDQLNAYVALDSMQLNLKGQHYFFDSIITKANSSNGSNDIVFRSPLADITAKGAFQYDKVGASMIQYIDAHYNITGKPAEQIEPQQIAFEGVIKKHPLIPALVPGLLYDDITFKGNYASQGGDSALNMTADIPSLKYKDNAVTKAQLLVSSKNSSIAANLDFAKLLMGSNTLYATSVQAYAANDSISVDVATKDVKGKDRFAFGTMATSRDDVYTFSMKKDLLLNYQKWDVAPNNKITYGAGGVLAENFILTNGEQKIAILSRNNVLNSPVDVTIDSFDIRDITSLFNNDTLFAAGVVNGKFSVSEFDKKIPAFTGNMELSKVAVMQQPVGTIKLFAAKQDDNTINATVDLSDNGNMMAVKGNYYLNNEAQQFDADINITRLSMATVQAFSQGNLVRSSGSLNGKIAINGKFTDPRWKGQLGFDTTKFTLSKLGTTYTIDQQKIELDYPAVVLNKFTIKDTTGHDMVIDGSIKKTTSITDYDLALHINANDFILVNTPRAVNSQVFGFAAVNAEMNISGNSSSPGIEGNVSLDDKSDVTIVLPESNINKDAARSVVRFIDRDTFALPEKVTFAPAIEQRSSFAQFLNYNLNIEVSKKAALTIVIDPTTGDELKVQGDAQLNAGVDPGGNIILAGNYELNSGYYVLNYQFLKRQFNLLPGSTITFSGTPMDAQVNISAEYIVNTAAKDLLGNEVGEADPKVSNTFNQKIPFRVLLYLKGAMKKPEISFDIELPDENSNTAINNELRTTIENKLTQLRGDAAATNKQVFSLLLLNRFVGEQSTDFFKGNGSNFNDVARESVSKFLSSALDQIASDLFKGVDIDLNLNSYKDYTTGDEQQRTDLNIAVTKSFLDDRLSISVGKNFGIEGQDAAAKTQQRSNSIIPDVTVNYKLTKDGKYMIRAYKKNQFEVILDGYVVETGVAFILTLDYDKFGELFHKKNK
ncbi:translocation/assembly module TamB domain-containing protein [Ferruginibacter sp.]